MKVLNITYKFNETGVLTVDERLQLIESYISDNDIIICSEFYLCKIEGSEGKITFVDVDEEDIIKSKLEEISKSKPNVLIIPGTNLVFDSSLDCFLNKTYIYHDGFQNEHVKKNSGGTSHVINNLDLLYSDCFISSDHIADFKIARIKRNEAKVIKYSHKLKGYITYEIENFFLIIKICADYCESYEGSTNDKYKMVLNTAYGLPLKTDRNNGDVYIISDGILGPYIDIKNSGLNLASYNHDKFNNITLANYNITIKVPYVEPEPIAIPKYIPPRMRNAEQQIDTSNREKYLKYKKKYIKLKKLLFK